MCFYPLWLVLFIFVFTVIFIVPLNFSFFSMKCFGSTVDFTLRRNAEIMRVYRQKIAEVPIIHMDEICRLIADSPSSRFWVSERRAAIVISAMEAGRPVPLMTDTKREMFDEIFRRYKELRARFPDASTLELATRIVHQPAPKFYFTPRTVREFVRRIRSGWYDRKQCSLVTDGFSAGIKG